MVETAGRVRASLTRSALRDLRALTRVLGLSGTDVVNRALQLYRVMEEARSKGEVITVGGQEMTWSGPKAAEDAWRTVVMLKRTADLEHKVGLVPHLDAEVRKVCTECDGK